jgi:hypothetical protein
MERCAGTAGAAADLDGYVTGAVTSDLKSVSNAGVSEDGTVGPLCR